jgi:hypothetical protein
MARPESIRPVDARPAARPDRGRARSVYEAYGHAREQCQRTQAAFQRLRQAQDHGQPDGPEGAEFLDHLRAFHELNHQFHEMQGRAEHRDRRAMHEAFKLSHDAYREAQAARAGAKKARDRGEDDSSETATFHARVRAYHELSRAAHVLAAGVEPSCGRDGLLPRVSQPQEAGEED